MQGKSGNTVDTVRSYCGRLSTPAALQAAGVKILSFVSVLGLSAACFGPSLLMAPAAAQDQSCMASVAAQDPSCNVVIILTDNIRPDDLEVMTETKALISTGTTFPNMFLARPSRATFLTGQYPHNHGVITGGYNKLNHSNTLPVWLQAAGYYTSHIGKYLGGYGQETSQTLVPPGWTNWQGLVDPSTYKMYDYTINDNGTLVRYGTDEEDYQTDVLADRAVETIDEATLSSQPFFLSIAPVPPNEERDQAGNRSGPRPAPRHVGAFGSEPLPKPPSFNESDVSDKPPFIRKLPRLSSSQIRNITLTYRNRLASLLAVDDLVGRVVDKLSAAGVLDDTVVIFTSDNGWFMGEHRIASGHERVYEEAVRVPLLIQGGGFPEGETANQFASNVDLAPTIVELAGADASLPVDGQSLVPWLTNPGNVTSRTLLIEAPKFKAVRNKDYVYVEHDSGARELYDMRRTSTNYDPYQLRSRHAASGYSQARSQLANKLNQLRNCAGANCIVP